MIRSQVNTRQQFEPAMAMAPVGGLNGVAPQAAMPPQDAFLMDNLIPGVASVTVRNGSEKYTDTFLPGAAFNLEVYAGADGDQMLAWAADRIYDVSISTPASLKTGLTAQVVPSVAMFSNAADNSQHMIIVNGYDTPMHYDGSAIANLTMTGIGTPANLNIVFAFKEHLYFGARDTLGFYYLPAGAIQGALDFFDLAQVSKLGGYLTAIASYSEGTTGETPQDFIVFITSKGECIVYAGYDPASVDTWVLVGRYFAPTPVTGKCAFNYNGELTILTIQGALPMSRIRKGITGDADQTLTYRLGRFLTELNTYSGQPCWQGLTYSRSGWLIVNAPTVFDPINQSEGGISYTFVMNTVTGRWCRFTNWNALSYTVFNNRLYFGRYDGYIMLADEGNLDDGVEIEATCRQAYNYFNDETVGFVYKHFMWAQISVKMGGGEAGITSSYSVDFNDLDIPPGVEFSLENPGVEKLLVTLNLEGGAGSLALRFVTDCDLLEWYFTQYAIQRTGNILP